MIGMKQNSKRLERQKL